MKWVSIKQASGLALFASRSKKLQIGQLGRGFASWKRLSFQPEIKAPDCSVPFPPFNKLRRDILSFEGNQIEEPHRVRRVKTKLDIWKMKVIDLVS